MRKINSIGLFARPKWILDRGEWNKGKIHKSFD